MLKQIYGLFERPWYLVAAGATLMLALILIFFAPIALEHLIAEYLTGDASQQIGDVFNLNHYLVKFVYYALVIVFIPVVALTISFNRKNVKKGLFALTALYGLLSLVLGIGLWLNPMIDQRCYTLTPSGVNFRELAPGQSMTIDPQNGRQCMKVTAEILPVLERYAEGERPTEIVENDDINFFSSVSGEAIVWFTRYASGEILIYDLLGFDPLTGEQLLPVTKQIVAEWKQQVQGRRDPVQLKGEFRFFGVRGQPVVWYGRNQTGEVEFFDGRGHHPITGVELRPVTREFVEKYFQDLDRIRVEKEIAAAREKAAREAEEAERQKTLAAEEVERKKALFAGDHCDRYAGNPNDPRRNTSIPGVPYSVLAINAQRAIEECSSALTAAPDNSRYRYQLARAKQAIERETAAELMSHLVSLGYPAAHDNLGWILLQRGKQFYPRATDIFERGAKLGDPDSMVSLAKMHSSGALGQKNLDLTLFWLERAAQLGHPEAQEMFAKYERERRNGQMAAQLFLGLLGTVIQNSPRR